MGTYQKVSLLLLRLSTGSLMLYAGITKVLDPDWTAAGYIGSAQNFKWFFNIVSSPFFFSFKIFCKGGGSLFLGFLPNFRGLGKVFCPSRSSAHAPLLPSAPL